MNEQLRAQLKYLRLPGLLANWDHYLEQRDYRTSPTCGC
jgi:hypothetical protein